MKESVERDLLQKSEEYERLEGQLKELKREYDEKKDQVTKTEELFVNLSCGIIQNGRSCGYWAQRKKTDNNRLGGYTNKHSNYSSNQLMTNAFRITGQTVLVYKEVKKRICKSRSFSVLVYALFNKWKNLAALSNEILSWNKNYYNEPPLVPYKYPLIGHTFEYYKDVPGFLKKCREEYGEIFSLYIWGSVQTYVGKELYHELFKNYNEFDFHSAVADTFPMSNFLNRPENFFRPIGRFVKDLLHDLEKYTARVQYEMIKSFDEFIDNEGVFQPPLQIIELIIARPLAATFVGDSDIMQDLMEEYQIDENNVDIRNVADFLMNFIFASVHSTSMAFTYCLHEYINNPEYHEELLEEAKVIYNEYKHLPYYAPEILDKMVKMGNFIKETLRVNWHDVSLPHKVMTSQFTFGNGYQVPEGRVFQIFTQLIHHDPKVYGSTPEKFNLNHHKNSPAHRPERNFLLLEWVEKHVREDFLLLMNLKSHCIL
ncbi:cytochrome P450 [Glomus cerebriforme]|uniref:Cytochrome P450 n=1 Tax=Glomus cerebriforme TaxID=658196 RepID=A0A397T1G0_9GLOM|nr:cytochrome P450 [Glomus cerebriforme]